MLLFKITNQQTQTPLLRLEGLEPSTNSHQSLDKPDNHVQTKSKVNRPTGSDPERTPLKVWIWLRLDWEKGTLEDVLSTRSTLLLRISMLVPATSSALPF